MKSLFKRTLAAASGSVLCLTQLAAPAVNVNITAVTAAAAEASLVIDKDALLYVPVPKVNPEIATYEGREQPSDWNDRLDLALTASETKEVEIYGLKARDLAKKQIKKFIESSNRYGTVFTEEDIDAVLARIRNAVGVMNTNGTAVATVSLADISDIVAEIVERNYTERTKDGRIKDGYGNAFAIDWTGFVIAGSITTEASIDYDTKTVTYTTVFTDEKGNTYNDDEIENYVLAKIDEGQQLIIASAAAQGCTTDKLETALEARAKIAKAYDGYIRALVEAGKTISVSGTDIETVYSDYMAAVDATIESTEIPEHLVNRLEPAIDKRQPATALGALDSPRVNDWITTIVDIFNDRYGETVTIDLSTADAKAIANDGYDWNIAINGYAAEVEFSLPDDQHDELLDKIHAALDATYAAEGKTIVDVVSHKVVNASADTIYGTSGELYYDVIRVIDEIITEDITTDTTTTTTTTEITTTTTTDTTPEGETTTTTTDTTPEGETTTTTTDTTPEGETTTTTTDTTPEGETTTTTTDTTPEGETTTTTSDTTTDITTTTSTDTTPETTTTTAATYVSFEVNGITDNNLVYWTEETAAFDLSQLSVKLHFVIAGVDQPEVVDVTEYFKADATNPSELTLGEGLGYDYVPVYIRLVDEDAIQQIIRDNGFGDELIEQEGLYNGKEIDKLRVHLTVRGNMDLDGKIDSLDAQYALLYFLETDVLNFYADEVIEESDGFLARMSTEDKIGRFQFAHYAADAFDGNGEITALDAQTILRYFLENTVLDLPTDWDELTNSDVVPFDDLHAAPLGRDEYVRYTDGWQLTEAPAETPEEEG